MENALSGYFEKLQYPQIVIPLLVWSALWSGLALWKSARNNQKPWFIFFLFVHTAGVVEFIYIKFFAKKTK